MSSYFLLFASWHWNVKRARNGEEMIVFEGEALKKHTSTISFRNSVFQASACSQNFQACSIVLYLMTHNFSGDVCIRGTRSEGRLRSEAYVLVSKCMNRREVE